MPKEIRGRGPRSHPPLSSLHDKPLDQEEQETLDEFLSLTDGELNSFMELDGFITALMVMPMPEMPASWHGFVFGGASAEEVIMRVSIAESSGILALLLRHWRTVRRRGLGTQRWTLPHDEEDSCMRESDWAAGFLHAISVSRDEWEGQLTRERCEELLAPVRRLAELPFQDTRVPVLPALTEEEHEVRGLALVIAAGELYRGVRGRRSA